MTSLKLSAIAGLTISAVTLATTARAETIEEFLDAFHANPALMMQKLPSEIRPDGRVKSRGFIDEQVVAETLEERNSIRGKVIGSSVEPGFIPDLRTIDIRDPRGKKDEPEKLVEPGALVTNMAEIESRGLSNVKIEPSPWSDSYWPVYKGIAAHRYADRSFPNSKLWQENFHHVQTHPASAIVSSGDAAAIDRLSPAEKYDFAVGDSNFSLTRFLWRKGQITFEKEGHVASWLGYCHGWAPAATMVTTIPVAPVTVTNPSGIPVTFHPQDVKALNAVLWANATPKTRFVGNRCNVPRPPKNHYGRILDPACFDTNPATWHLALVNQMGIHKRSFIMDSTFDFEVWNFPLASYRYRYFNPLSRQDVPNFRLAAVPIENYKSDPFKEFRSPKARYVVGIYMDLTHLNAINPSRRMSSENAYKTIRLVYDLELDEGYNVIGGEWYSNAHPDFIWTFDRDAQAVAVEDANLDDQLWSPAFPVPTTWTSSAVSASNRGEPLATFVKGLISAPPPPPSN